MASPRPSSNSMSATTSNYLKICNDLGCNPLPELLTSLTGGLKGCTVRNATGELPDTQVIAICAVLPLASFEELCFAGLSLSSTSWTTVADACAKTRSLLRLSFRECTFKDGHAISSFGKAVSMTTVQQLEIDNCRLGDELLLGLCEGPLLKSENFHTLRLVGSKLTDEGVSRLAKTIEAVGMMSSLRVLDLMHNKVADRGAMALAAMLVSEASASSVPLNTLELEGNQVTDLGGLALCRAAKSALMLQRLNLSLNLTTGVTMGALAEAIRFNTGTLKDVSIAGCKASEEQVVVLIQAAHRNTTLQLLDVRGVALGAEGVAALCGLLRYTTSLSTLRCDIATREGAELIARDLPHNTSLMHITLGGPVPDALLARMSETLAANTVRQLTGSPAASSPHIHAWIEDSVTFRGRATGDTPVKTARGASASSPAPPELARSPRSEAGGSVMSHATQRTARSNRTHKTMASYISFGGFTDMSRRTVLVGNSPMRISASLAAGGAAEKAATIFRKHDQNQDNHLNRQEMLQALDEIGVLQGIKARHVGRVLDAEFKKADWDKDGRVSLQDFIAYYERIAHFQTQMAREGRIKSMATLNKQLIPPGAMNNAQLKRVFTQFSKLAVGQGRVYDNSVPGMNSTQFHRLCQEAKWSDSEGGRLSSTAIDVIFVRHRSASSRRLGFKEFVESLSALGYEMGIQFEDIMVQLGCKAAGGDPSTLTDSMLGLDGGAARVSGTTLSDLGLDVSGEGGPLPTVHEAPNEGAASHKKPEGGAKKKKLVKAKSTKSVNNPLYEVLSQAPAAASTPAGGPVTSSFNISALRASAPGSQGTLASRQGSVGSMDAAGIMAIEARLRAEMDARIYAVEERVAVAALSGGEAGMVARMAQLEGQVAAGAGAHAEAVAVGRQVAGLQDILQRLTEEIVRLKATSTAPQPSDSSAEVEKLTAQVQELAASFDEMKTDLASVHTRLDSLAAAVRQGAGGSAAGGVSAESMAAVEKKMSDRQARYEGALMQVAKQVDSLDSRLKEEHENTSKVLSTLLQQRKM